MYRKYKGKNIAENKVVQVLKDNTIAKLPLITAGMGFSKFETTKYGCSCKVDNNKIAMLAGDTIHILKYCDDGSIIELKNFKLATITNGSRWDTSIIQLNNNKLFIVYNYLGNVLCHILEVDESKGMYNLTEQTSIDNWESAICTISACKLQENKVVVGYANGLSFYDPNIPYFLIIQIDEDNTITLLSKTEIFTELDSTHYIKEYGIDTLHLAGINEDTFVMFNNVEKNPYSKKGYISVYNVNSINEIKRYDIFQNFNTVIQDFKLPFTKPFPLGDNKILYFDDGNATILEVIKDKIDNYYFNIIDSIKAVYDFGEFNIGALQKYEDGSMDLLIFKTYSYTIININKDKNKIVNLKTDRIDITTVKCGTLINLEKNKCFYQQNLGSYYLINYNSDNGNILGLAKDKEIVCIDGVCELNNTNLEIGKKYYYDANGDLTTVSENNEFIGYAVDTDKIIINPQQIQSKTSMKKYTVYGASNNKVVQVLSSGNIKNLPITTGKIIGLHTTNGNVVIQGFARNLGIELQAGQKYYYDADGNLTLESENTFLGYAVSNNTLYIPKYLS